MKNLRDLALAAVAFAACPAFADQVLPTEQIVVPAHDIQRGEIIADSDLAYQQVAANAGNSGAVTSIGELSGMEARRFLHAGEPVRADDVRRPILVTKGSTVTMTFEAPGIVLTAVGRAMSEGGLGESVVVLNPASYRQITGVVTGPGQVRAGEGAAAPAQQIAQSN